MARIYVDMDGTLTRFYDDIVDDDGSVQLAKMYQPDFFLNLKPDENLLHAVKYLAKSGVADLFVISAYDHAHPDIELQKMKWLDKYLPEIEDNHRIFTVIGQPKAKYSIGGVRRSDVLIDDYNLNLREWSNAGGASIKYVNDRNHRGSGSLKGDIGNVWTGSVIDHSWSQSIMIALITQIVNDAKQRKS